MAKQTCFFARITLCVAVAAGGLWAQEGTSEPSGEQPQDQVAEQPQEQPSEQPSEQPQEQPSEQPQEQPAEQPQEQPAEQPQEQPSEQPQEQPSEQPQEQPEEQPQVQPEAPAVEESGVSAQEAAPAATEEPVAKPAPQGPQSTEGFNEIAGPLPKVVKARDEPYLVVADIEVPANRMVTIEPGAVFLFRNFTGLHVQGRLVCEGSKSDPIVFTSEFDTAYNPGAGMEANPFDWDGIYIHHDGIGSVLSFCKVFYSVYGIRSDTKFIKIDPAQFRYNGKTNLTIEGVEHQIGRRPYSYVLSTKDATVDGVPVNLLRDPAAPRRNVLRYVSLAGLVGGAGAAVYQATQWTKAQEEFDELSAVKFENLNENTSSEWQQAQEYRNRDMALTIVSGAVGLIGAVGFVWSFTF